MTKKEPKIKADLRKPWESFSDAEYRKATAHLFHFSAKAVNSNTPWCGIRLAADVHVRLPYVSVSTLNASCISYDFVGNAAESGPASQVLAVVEGTVNERFKGVAEGEVALIQDLAAILASRAELATAEVGARLRQILIPVEDGEGGYVALTPLHASGLSGLINRRVREEREQEELDNVLPRTRRRVADFPIGGAKPQNIGIRIKGVMTRPLVFFAPQERPDTQKAFSVHFRGVSLAPPRVLLDAFYAERAKLVRQNENEDEYIRTNARVRAAETQSIRNMVRVVASRAADARSALADIPEFSGQVSNDIDEVVRGALVPDLRGHDWVRNCAAEITRAIARHKSETGPALSDAAANGLRPEIEAAVREYF